MRVCGRVFVGACVCDCGGKGVGTCVIACVWVLRWVRVWVRVVCVCAWEGPV